MMLIHTCIPKLHPLLHIKRNFWANNLLNCPGTRTYQRLLIKRRKVTFVAVISNKQRVEWTSQALKDNFSSAKRLRREARVDEINKEMNVCGVSLAPCYLLCSLQHTFVRPCTYMREYTAQIYNKQLNGRSTEQAVYFESSLSRAHIALLTTVGGL